MINSDFKKRYNILVCGTLYSGSSAMHDLLREYENIGHFPTEFDDFRAPGLVADQLIDSSGFDYPNDIDKITRNSNLIKRLFFKSLIWKYIFNCIPNKYLEIDYDIGIFRTIKDKLISQNNTNLLRHLNESLKTDITVKEKVQLAHSWIQDIGNNFSSKKDFMMFDQPILTSTDRVTWTTVFDPFKLIIVYRDPRDQIADLIERKYLFNPYGSPFMTIAGDNLEAIYGRDKKGALKFHIDAIKNRLKWIDYMEKTMDPDKLLILDFEGLVYNYDEYKSKVEDFIGGIRDKHKLKNKYFNPFLSKNNIGIYKKYLNEDDLKEFSEIKEWYLNKIGNRKNIYPDKALAS